jgi:H+/gluconate symporter-like permease
MAFLNELAALSFLMFVAYRGYSVILFAPIAALGAVLLTEPTLVAPIFTGLFMDKMVGFLKLYFPVFMLGALFGKLIELSGFSKSIVAATINLVGRSRAILSIVLVCAVLTYGGVSLFVVVFIPTFLRHHRLGCALAGHDRRGVHPDHGAELSGVVPASGGPCR